jgi:predicted Zn-dependent peptidase
MRSVLNHFAFKDAFQSHPEFMDGKVSAKNQEKISFDDVKAASKLAFYLSHLEVYSSGPMTLDATKNLVQSEILGSEETVFKKILFEKIQPNDFKHKELRITVLNKPAATDNQILFIFPNTFGENLKARVIGQVASFLLGGSGSSDLFRILRTERGLTYGASSRVDNNRNFWTIATFGGIKQTPGLLSGVPEIVQKFRARKIAKKDLAEAKKMLKVSFRDSLELPEDRLDYIMSLSLNDVDISLVDQYEKILDSINTKDIEIFAKTKLTTDDGFLYLMGDEKVLLPMMDGKANVRKVQLDEVP